MARTRKLTLRAIALLALLLAGPMLMLAIGRTEGADWRTASNAPVGIAPDPATNPQAIVQVYAARAFGWRGAFGVHSWISVKPEGAPRFTSYHVIGWRARYGGNAIATYGNAPDRRWFGAEPTLLAHLDGPAAAAAIPDILAAIDAYPFARTYRVWPGPNSNTFTAWIAREVPALALDLPPTAIGKDYLGDRIAAPAVSGTGWQVSLFGLFGLTAALEEGLEVNLAGMTFGIDPDDLNLKLPGIGRIGPAPERGPERSPAHAAPATH